ncbi:MAG: zinc ribbon domain-containing protein, partial [Chloroflexi bacterium]|nr:zinc ribbon domain-containing protein [Chloroflexota bacterium]
MPTYQYRCLDCKRPFEIFLSYSDYESYKPACQRCQSEHVQRRIGRIRIAKSDERRFENMADPAAL